MAFERLVSLSSPDGIVIARVESRSSSTPLAHEGIKNFHTIVAQSRLLKPPLFATSLALRLVPRRDNNTKYPPATARLPYPLYPMADKQPATTTAVISVVL